MDKINNNNDDDESQERINLLMYMDDIKKSRLIHTIG